MSNGSEQPEDRRQQNWFYELAEKHPGFVFVGGVALYIIVGIGLWKLLDVYIDPKTSTQKKDLIQALGFIMAGAAGIIGVYFTWQTFSQARKSQVDTQASTQETLRIAQEGQVTERFSRAIDQLGEMDE